MSNMVKVSVVGRNAPLNDREKALFEEAFPGGEVEIHQPSLFRGHRPSPKEVYIATTSAAEAGYALVEPAMLPSTSFLVIGGAAQCLFFTRDRGTGRRALRSMVLEHQDYKMSEKERARAGGGNAFRIAAIGKGADAAWLGEKRDFLTQLHERAAVAQSPNLSLEEWEEMVKGKRPDLVIFEDASQLMAGAYNALLLRRPTGKGEKLTPDERRFRHASFSTVGGTVKLVEFFLRFYNLAEEK